MRETQILDRGGNLKIFEHFQVDRELPKHRQPEEKHGSKFNSDMMMSSGSTVSWAEGGTGGLVFSREVTKGLQSLSIWQRLLLRALRWFTPESQALDVRIQDTVLEPVQITVQDFFKSVKNSTQELRVVIDRAKGFDEALRRARQTGQKAMEERLLAGAQAVRAESQLLALGLTKFLSEETLVEFVKKSPRGLRLDWVRNFTRLIPDEVLETKVKCDELLIFDNYVVLHYDPEGKSWAETQAEVEARKDPILFGVVEGKRVLYYIGDWVDEYCDLTLEGLAEVLGREVPEVATEIDPEDFGG